MVRLSFRQVTLEWHLTKPADAGGGKEGGAPTKYELQWRLGAEGASWCSSAGSRAITVSKRVQPQVTVRGPSPRASCFAQAALSVACEGVR